MNSIAIAALSLTACGYDCGTASSTVASGVVRDAAGVSLATANVSLSDNVNPSFLRLSVGVNGSSGSAGAPLKGHVTRGRLLGEDDVLLAEIPTGTSTLYSDGVVALNADLPSRSEYDRVRTAVLTNRAKVVLDTDLPGRATIVTTVIDAHDVPGVINSCQIGQS